MTDAIRPLIAGNWKMNGLKSALGEFEAMIAGAGALAGKADLLVCPPATLIAGFADKALGSKLTVGAQDCHPKASGAHTGDLSAEMLADAGASAIIVGHSERRADHGETDALVRQKAEAAWRAGLIAIVCIGETRASATPAGRWILRRPACRLAAGWCDSRQSGRRLRAGLGDRHRADADAGDVEQVHRFIRGVLTDRSRRRAARSGFSTAAR